MFRLISKRFLISSFPKWSRPIVSEANFLEVSNDKQFIAKQETPNTSQNYVKSEKNLPSKDLEMDLEEISSHETEEEENTVISQLRAMATTISNKNLPRQKKGEKKFAICHFRAALKSYLLACINADMVESAHRSFLFYLYRFSLRESASNPIDTSVFNMMLKGWAIKGNLSKLSKIFSLMTRFKVPYDMNTFAALILAIVNQKSVDLVELSHTIKMLQDSGLQLENLMADSNLIASEREKIVEVFTSLMPEIVFKGTGAAIDYPCKLLENFKDAPRTCYEVVPSKFHPYLSDWFKEQKTDETRGIMQLESVYIYDQQSVLPDDLWDKCLQDWRVAIADAFSRNLKTLRNMVRGSHNINIVPYLTALDTEEYVNIVMDSVITFARFYKTYSPPISFLCRDIGQKFNCRYHAYLKNKMYPEWPFYYEEYLKYYRSPEKIGEQGPRNFWNNLIETNGGRYNPKLDDFHLTPPQISAIGKFLLDILLHYIKIDANIINNRGKKQKYAHNVPVFFTVHGDSNWAQEEIRMHRVFRELFKIYGAATIPFDITLLPMKVPPSPWISVDNGGYLLCQTDFLRPISYDEEEWMNLDLARSKNINPVLDSLNALSMVTWKINQEVLDVAINVFRSGGDTSIDIPLHESKMPSYPKLNSNLTRYQRFSIAQEKKKARQDRQNMYSLWCDCLYKLSIASHFKDRVFWLPHNIDFRGRVYACPPHLNHLGNDLSRSLMLFAKGKALGPTGLDWLKIHLVNLTGLKKRESIQTRLEYCNEIINEITDSAENPLTGRKWWAKQEEPWQVLACCMEIVRALKSPDPSAHVSYFPIHQDGSCNGLQHYAALGRDLKGAISVNLSPGDKPNDVYSDVAELVEVERQQDAKNGNKIAIQLEGKIKRKVIKQTVMTYVYGVTAFGAKHQIHKQLKELEGIPEESLWQCSVYLARKTFKSIATMFEATQAVQHWFVKCAKVISQNLCAPVEWQTPLGFPVLQPYFLRFTTQDLEALLTRSMRPNAVKQKNAFPPNFIHSLDSSHMMLTALDCERNGLNFVAIHDSYWTHPIDINAMNKICREKFVALHSEEILENLSKFMLDRYGQQVKLLLAKNPDSIQEIMTLFQAVPKKGTFDLKNVINSVYFFS